MPRSLEPNSRLVFVLACDQDKPKETQPRLIGRTLTLGKQRGLLRAMDSLRSASTADERIDTALDAAMVVLTGWENMVDTDTGQAIPFSRESLQDVLCIEEIIEVLEFAAIGGRLNADDRKKSESPHSSSVENFA